MHTKEQRIKKNYHLKLLLYYIEEYASISELNVISLSQK